MRMYDEIDMRKIQRDSWNWGFVAGTLCTVFIFLVLFIVGLNVNV